MRSFKRGRLKGPIEYHMEWRPLFGWIAGLFLAVSCVKADDTLGEGFDPGDQQLLLGKAVLEAGDFFETRLWHTDSLRSSNVEHGYFGVQKSPAFGTRRASFLAQYRAAALSDKNGFGYEPIFDSLCLKLYVQEHAGDTLQPIKYNIYEVLNSDYINKDTTFYPTFDPTPYVASEPAFTFTFPDGVKTGPWSEYIRVTPTERGMALIRRWMLLDGGLKLSIYDDPTEWVRQFPGVYIAPVSDPSGEGNIFSTKLEGTGFLLKGRNRNPKDPSLIQDTVSASYIFQTAQTAAYRNASINRIEHETPLTVGQKTERIYIEGMNGVQTSLTFTDALMRRLDEICSQAGAKSLILNQARLSIAMSGGDLPAAMDRALPRLGLYTSYKNVETVADYAYAYEATGEITLPYGGYLNRTQGAYQLDIPSYLQQIWNQWRQEQRGETVADRIPRTVILAPGAYALYSMPQTVAWGMAGGENPAPLRLEIVYTLTR